MTIKIGINGFGRMGRLGLRAALDHDGDAPDMHFVQINEIACDAAGSAHLLQFDSVHGRWGHECAGEGEFAGILGYEERPLVSVDFLNDPRSSIVDALSIRVIDGTQVKIYAWYDNEWGYVSRMMDIVRMLAQGL